MIEYATSQYTQSNNLLGQNLKIILCLKASTMLALIFMIESTKQNLSLSKVYRKYENIQITLAFLTFTDRNKFLLLSILVAIIETRISMNIASLIKNN